VEDDELLYDGLDDVDDQLEDVIKEEEKEEEVKDEPILNDEDSYPMP